MIILDTNVVSELIRATPDPGVRAWVNSLPSTQIATTAITAAELTTESPVFRQASAGSSWRLPSVPC